ncbi:hypothetical protein [Natrinema versiforme]|uniref:Uncharacterized protein n=1 Tax=Natrinema versiforme TaxID=88724 RepID=A0A4P8WII1_9EURY|nr:hypothetical protein [Natrinema versiforme]QCS43015.1 hypothetical protein FEJ81_11840 [Natrinema versiforme]
MAAINKYRVSEGESIELPTNITESAIHVSGEWLYVVEDESETTATYTRRRELAGNNPQPPIATDVLVLNFDSTSFEYLEEV